MSYASEAVKRNRRKTAALIAELKSKPCADCKVQYPYYVMHFDHVRGVKEFNLSAVTRTNIARSRVLAEVAKCDVVCANCHAERTQQRLEGCQSG